MAFSIRSSLASATRGGLVKPGAPSSIAVTWNTVAAATSTATVTFTAGSPPGLSYTVYATTGSSSTLPIAITPGATGTSISSLTNNTSYTFTVTAKRGALTNSTTSTSSLSPLGPVTVEYVKPDSLTNMILWLDAYDPNATGTLPSSSTPLSSWKDKSGNSNNVTYDTGGTNAGATASTNQWDNNTLNGGPSVYLYGNARYYGNFTALTNQVHFFGVATLNTGSQNYGRLIGMGNGTMASNGNDPLAFCRQGGTTYDLQRPNSALVNNSVSYNTPYIWEMWFDGTNANTVVISGNTTTIKSTAYSANLLYNFFTLGSAPSRNDNAVAYMSEIIVYNKALSTTDRQKIEGYLSLKYGLNANLPSTHPYYKSGFFNNSCSSLAGWVTNGFSVATVGSQTCFTATSGSYYVYINSGATTLKGRTIGFNVYLTGGCPNFYFCCNSAGLGQMLRFEQRSSGGSGFTTTSSWTGWSAPGSNYTWTQNTWLAIVISIGSDGVATFSVNGAASGITYTIADNGRYIGVQSDGGGGSISINNIVIT